MWSEEGVKLNRYAFMDAKHCITAATIMKTIGGGGGGGGGSGEGLGEVCEVVLLLYIEVL